MAVTLGNTSTGQVSAATSLTVAHTHAGGSDVAAFCITVSRSRNVTSNTYDGTAMTSEVSDTAYQGAIHLWSLPAPASGSKNVVATVSGGPSDITIRTVDFSNVDQAVLLDATNSGHVVSTSLSRSVTTVDSNTYVVGGGSIEANTTLSATSGQTKFGEQYVSTSTIRSSGGYELIATPASTAMSWGAGTSNVMLCVVGAIAEVVAPIAYTTTVSDSISLSDTLSKIHGIAVSIVESISLTGVIAYVSTYAQTVSESLALNETAQTVTAFARIISESLSFSDTADVALVIPISITESIALSDTNSAVLSFGTIISETLNLNETVTVIRETIVSVTESITLSDTTTVGLTYVIAVTETITMVEDWFKQGWSWMQKNTGGVWTFLTKNTP